MKKIMLIVVSLVMTLAMAACAETSTEGQPSGATATSNASAGPQMGRGKRCNHRLANIIDTAYLAEHDLEVKDKDAATIAVGGAIAEVCMKGPATLTVAEGGEKVIEIVKNRYANG